MTQKCGGRPLTEEQTRLAVRHSLWLEERRDIRRLGKEFESNWIEVKAMIEPLPELEKIVMMNIVSGTNSLSAVEWQTMESAMPTEERQTHKNLKVWMEDRAKDIGAVQVNDEDDDDDDDPTLLAMLESGEGKDGEGGFGGDSDDDKDEPATASAAKAKAAKEQEEEDAAVGTIDKAKNWSAVNVTHKETKMSWRGVLTPLNFTNWLWYRCIRPKLEDTKAKKLSDIEDFKLKEGIDAIEEIMGEFMPKIQEDKDKKDKKDKKDDKDKKDKKDKKDDKDTKDDKKADKGKDDKAKKTKKKDAVILNATEKLQVQNLIKNMIYAEGKEKAANLTVKGWANMVEAKDIAPLIPWEFQIGHVLRQCMALEYSTKKKKENPNPEMYYEMVQNLADCIAMLRKQYKFEFPDCPEDNLLPMMDALELQQRFREESVGTLKFDLLWYLKHAAHLISGSSFMKKHKTTDFRPFKIQELMVDAILQPGPQLIFGIAPPGTGKTAVVAHLLNLFPCHNLVFCCPALPVVLAVGRIANTLGIPYAFVKGRRLTPSFACGRGLATHVDMPATTKDGVEQPAMTAVQSLKWCIAEGNLERKKKRLAEKKRLRNLHNLKRNPRIYLMCDVSSCAWLLRQLDANRTILVVDEPPMGSDQFHETPEAGKLACAMIQTMMTPMYKTIWMSATLPRMENLPTLVNSFLERFRLGLDKKEFHVRECFSTQLDRGALMCGPSGCVAFPHQSSRTHVELKKLCKRLPLDPLVLKAYTERALASLLDRWSSLRKEGKLPESFIKEAIPPEVKFADLSELNHASIREYAMEILGWVAATDSDDMVVGFCETRELENVFPQFNLAEMIFGNAYAFPGLTLVADDVPSERLLEMSTKLMSHMPKAQDLEDDLKAQEASQKKQDKYKDQEEGDQDEGAGPRLKFSSDLVIQSDAFLKRWCPNRPKDAPTIARVLPTVKEFMTIKTLPVDERWQMLALSGAGSFDPKLDVDHGNPVYTQWVHESMQGNKLACVTAGKEFTWGANVPASTVVVTASFAETTSVAGMLQYVGRAARRGLTTHGQAIFERDEDLARIFASPDGLSTEALTMERFAEWWLSGGKKW